MKNVHITLFIIALMVSNLCLINPAIAKEGHSSWKDTLTQEQRQQVAKLKLDFKALAIPNKAKIKQVRIELALLVTADEPDQNAIDKKVDEILKLKGENMRAKARLGIAIRKLLNEAQRVQFDLHVLKKASQGKKRSHYKGHH